jgi:hypothetical protein
LAASVAWTSDVEAGPGSAARWAAAPAPAPEFLAVIAPTDRRELARPGSGSRSDPFHGVGFGSGSGTVGHGIDLLDAPANLAGAVVPEGSGYIDIRLTWIYQDLGAQWFDVARAIDAGRPTTVGKVDYRFGVTHYGFLDPHLPKGPTYHYWVKAVSGSTQSPAAEVDVPTV